MRSLLVVALLLPSLAHAENRCIGGAIPGALGGMALGSAATFAGFGLAHADINDPAHATRNSFVIGSALLGGATLGPIASCAIVGDEGHAVPIATFVIGGVLIGGAATGIGWFAFDDYRERHLGGTPEDRAARAEGAGGLGAILMAVGGAAGGLGGYYLHRRLFRDTAFADVAIVPAPRGLSISARF